MIEEGDHIDNLFGSEDHEEEDEVIETATETGDTEETVEEPETTETPEVETKDTNGDLEETTESEEDKVDNRSPAEKALINELRMERLEKKQAAEEAKRLKAEGENYRKQIEQWHKAQAALQKQNQAPTLQDDPEAYYAYREQVLQQQMTAMQVQMEAQVIQAEIGSEKFEAVKNWATQRAQADPTFGQIVDSQASPVRFLVQEYENATRLETLNDPTKSAEWIKAEAERLGFIPKVEDTPTPQPKAVPGGTLAGEPSAGRMTEKAEKTAFDEMFGDKL